MHIDCDGIPIYGDAWEVKEMEDIAAFNREVAKLGNWRICACCGRHRLNTLFLVALVPLTHPKLQPLIENNKMEIVDEGTVDNTANVCLDCWHDLNANTPKIPEYAKRNGFNFGKIPLELRRLNRMEIGMVSRVVPLVQVCTLRGGQLAHSSNCIAFKRKVLEVVNKLPRAPIDTGIVYVRSPSSQPGIYRHYKVHPRYIREALDWLIQNNYLYSNIEIDEPLLQDLELNVSMPTEEINADIAERLRNPTFQPIDNETESVDQIDYVVVHVPDSDTLVDALPVYFLLCCTNISNNLNLG